MNYDLPFLEHNIIIPVQEDHLTTCLGSHLHICTYPPGRYCSRVRGIRYCHLVFGKKAYVGWRSHTSFVLGSLSLYLAEEARTRSSMRTRRGEQDSKMRIVFIIKSYQLDSICAYTMHYLPSSPFPLPLSPYHHQPPTHHVHPQTNFLT